MEFVYLFLVDEGTIRTYHVRQEPNKEKTIQFELLPYEGADSSSLNNPQFWTRWKSVVDFSEDIDTVDFCVLTSKGLHVLEIDSSIPLVENSIWTVEMIEQFLAEEFTFTKFELFNKQFSHSVLIDDGTRKTSEPKEKVMQVNIYPNKQLRSAANKVSKQNRVEPVVQPESKKSALHEYYKNITAQYEQNNKN